MKLGEELLELLYPSRCAFCGKLRGKGVGICGECAGKLPYTRGLDRQQRFPHMERCLSPLYYEDLVRESLLRYKFGGRQSYASIYGEILAKCLDENGISCDIITWVPLSRRRLRARGYDQARLLAEDLAKRSGFPCARLLVKIRHTAAQSSTGDAARRRANIAGAYALLPGTEMKDKRVLLIDDIVTTGSTLSEAAGVLRRAGARSVVGMSLARRRE